MRWPRVRLWVLLLVVAGAALAFSMMGFTPRARRYRAMAGMEAHLAMSELAAAAVHRAVIAKNSALADEAVFVTTSRLSSRRITRSSALKGCEQRAADHLRRRYAFLWAARLPWLGPPRFPLPKRDPELTAVRPELAKQPARSGE